MISIKDLSVFVGGQFLYQNASLHIKPKDKIGLVGLNGSGKTTLLRIINGEQQPDQGKVSKAKGCSIGFLNQDLLSYESDQSIVNVALEAFKETVEMQKQIDDLLVEMESNYQDHQVEELAHLQEKFEAQGGYSLQSQAEEILEGVGFSTTDLHRPLNEFSGGWRMRVMLAKLLLEKPSLLMLDEPTNHLDLPSIQWIESYLRNYEGAVVVVSHDRQFLDNTVKTIVEVANQKLTTYVGNYSQFKKEKEQRDEIQRNAFQNQQQAIKQTERFIERFKAKSTKAKQVQSRIKALERLEKVEEVGNDQAHISFKFQFQQQPGRHLVHLKNVSKSFGELQVFDNASISIERGDKIALIGANGKGKSTLLRIIAGTEKIEGKREWGYNVIPTFYAQHQLEALHLKNEMLDELKQAGSYKSEMELRNLLGCFLFTGDDVFKKIKVLSGGEKSRVALAKTLISEANFMLLDEPTNHLDFISENILIQALQQYQGSFIIVSHNRYFISQVANKIWCIENKQIKEYPGTYQEYEYWVNNSVRSLNNHPEPMPEITKVKVGRSKPRHNTAEKAIRHCQTKIQALEEAISALEKDKSAAEIELTKPKVFGNPRRLKDENIKYKAFQSQLDQKHDEWIQLQLKMEELEKK